MSRPSRTLCLALASAFVIIFAVPSALAQQDDISVKEWDVPMPNSDPHDIVVDGNGLVWYTAIGANKIGMFDPATEEFREFDIPTPSSRPHGLVADADGNIWFTEQGASKIGKLDPETGDIDEFPTPTPGSGAHTPIMGDGVLWFTEQSASKIARLDVETGEIEEFATPTPNSSPYGIILDADDNPWYAALSGHRIGKVNAETGEIAEYPTPTAGSGTRRIAIDSEGKLWFTEYNAGKIGSFDPATDEFNEYDTSSRSSGPYAIWVDIYDNVWFSMTDAPKMGRFDQSTGMLHEYDMPTPNTTSRFIYADSEGKVWFPNDVNDKIGVITLQQDSADPSQELVITEVELSPPTTDGSDGVIWVEVHNPTDKTFLTPIEISTLEGFSFLLTSTTFRPDEYKVFEVWSMSHPDKYPSENAVLALYTSSEETHRTAPLSDTFADSRTWQLNGTEWEFAEATTTKAIPEFGSIAVIVIAAGIVGTVFLTRLFKGRPMNS